MGAEDRKKLSETLIETGGELLLDSQISDGIMREIPAFKILFAGYKTIKSIQDSLYSRKLKFFLENITDIDEKDFEWLLTKAEVEPSYLSATLLMIIDKIEDERKAIIIASAVGVYAHERFSFDVFNKILLMINRGFYSDLMEIAAFENHDQLLTDDKSIPSESLEELFSCGLLANIGLDGGNFENESGGTIYRLNKYGEIFLRIVKESKF